MRQTKPDSSRAVDQINLQSISRCLIQLGYEVVSLHRPWRHVVGEIEKSGHRLFFKMAAGSGINRATKNEVTWNRGVTNQLVNDSPFHVPLVVNTGNYGPYFYFIAEHCGKSLLTNRDTSLVEDHLARIANIAVALLSLKPFTLPRDEKSTQAERRSDFIATNRSWAEECKYEEAGWLLDLVAQIGKYYTEGLAHGDFTIEHLLVNKTDISLIDGEHASANRVMFYDIAYFAHRLWTKHERPELALRFIASTRDSLGKKRPLFDQLFPLVLASRAIGGFWDHYNSDGTDIGFHLSLATDILSHSLW
jgi:hypothetical protein